MEIKEQDEQRMVIALTLGNRLITILGALILGTVLYFTLPFHIGIAFGVVAGLIVLGELILPDKVVIDKLAQKITVRRRQFWFVPWQRVIPFSAVESVDLDIKWRKRGSEAGGGQYQEFQVFLNASGKKILIEASRNETHIWNLATEIGKFIGREYPRKGDSEALTVEEVEKAIADID